MAALSRNQAPWAGVFRSAGCAGWRGPRGNSTAGCRCRRSCPRHRGGNPRSTTRSSVAGRRVLHFTHSPSRMTRSALPTAEQRAAPHPDPLPEISGRGGSPPFPCSSTGRGPGRGAGARSAIHVKAETTFATPHIVPGIRLASPPHRAEGAQNVLWRLLMLVTSSHRETKTADVTQLSSPAARDRS